MKRPIDEPVAPAGTEGMVPALDGTTAEMAAHDEWLLDESLSETFPASDPIAPASSPKPNDA